jgi:hypothetical protein
MARKPRSVALTLDQRVFQPYKKVGLADDHHDAAKAAFLLGRDGIALPELLRPLSSHTVLGRAAPLGPGRPGGGGDFRGNCRGARGRAGRQDQEQGEEVSLHAGGFHVAHSIDRRERN